VHALKAARLMTTCPVHDATPGADCTARERCCPDRLAAYKIAHRHGGHRGSVPAIVPVPLPPAVHEAYREAPPEQKRAAREAAAEAIGRALK
jgi:hypothetical protein